jgi:hypothetical protein
MAIRIDDLDDKRVDKLKPNSELICCFCGDIFKFKDGYDASFCCEDCCIEQEELNIKEGRC